MLATDSTEELLAPCQVLASFLDHYPNTPLLETLEDQMSGHGKVDEAASAEMLS